eukprot:1053122-Prymnesium_polylepis.2
MFHAPRSPVPCAPPDPCLHVPGFLTVSGYAGHGLVWRTEEREAYRRERERGTCNTWAIAALRRGDGRRSGTGG